MSATTARTSIVPQTAEDRIFRALARRRAIVEARPGRALGTAVSRVTIGDGYTCEAREGDWEVVIDLPEPWGGSDCGPNPGVFGRAALGACLAMTYRRWAVHEGLPIHRLEVEVEADYDARGELGVSDVTPGYLAARYRVRVESPAPADEIRRVFDLADSRCPYLAVWRSPIETVRELEITPSGAAGAEGA